MLSWTVFLKYHQQQSTLSIYCLGSVVSSQMLWGAQLSNPWVFQAIFPFLWFYQMLVVVSAFIVPRSTSLLSLAGPSLTMSGPVTCQCCKVGWVRSFPHPTLPHTCWRAGGRPWDILAAPPRQPGQTGGQSDHTWPLTDQSGHSQLLASQWEYACPWLANQNTVCPGQLRPIGRWPTKLAQGGSWPPGFAPRTEQGGKTTPNFNSR